MSISTTSVSAKFNYYDTKRQAMSDASDRVVTKPTAEQIAGAKKIHIMAVCGKAMASLAELLIEAGFEVSGSDTSFYPPMGDLVKSLNIKTYETFSEQNIIDQKPDIIVVGNVVRPSNEEALYARQHNIPQISVSEALKHFVFNKRKVIVVAGTHGKTTTTGLLAHVLAGCDKNPGFLIGGIDQQTNKSAYLGGGDYFVIEGDEYNTSYFDKSPKFLTYGAHSAILTSIEMDHVDIYDDFEDYKKAFEFFVQDLPKDGHLLACGDSEIVRVISSQSPAQIHFYGSNLSKQPENEFTVRNIRVEDDMQYAEVYRNNTEVGTLKTKLFGEYNMLNCLSVFGIAHSIGCETPDIFEHISTYGGMKRRQEVLFDDQTTTDSDKKHITFVDDYAHHPTAVIETLKGMREKFGNRRFIVAFEFGSASNTKKVFEDAYEQAFSNADILLIRAMKRADHDPNSDSYLTPATLAQHINERSGTDKAKSFEDMDVLIEELKKDIKDGDVIITMSSNAFGGIQEKLVSYLKQS